MRNCKNCFNVFFIVQEEMTNHNNNKHVLFFFSLSFFYNVFLSVLLVPRLLLALLLIIVTTTTTTTTTAAAAATAGQDEINNNGLSQQQQQQLHQNIDYQYNICNGLSNQLFYHAASIAIAIKEQYQYVLVPDCYIIDGTQSTNNDVLPSVSNSVPFGYVFDKDYFQQTIEALAVTIAGTTTSTKVRFVKLDTLRTKTCAGMSAVVQADPLIMRDIVINAFRPSMKLNTIINEIQTHLNVHEQQRGICFHHRDGMDWHEHCSRWSSIPDGIYRGNCLHLQHDETIIESLYDRGLTNRSWIYYCGDHEPPTELTTLVPVYTKNKLQLNTLLNNVDDTKVYESRDVAALIDFFVCRTIPHFIGNSVSTFSALQIAIRKMNNTFWYNSQSIPLSELWRVYQMPVVYTYTELSKESGKYLLKASIASVRRHMPENQIHVLYHGSDDITFLQFLYKHNVTIHKHNPSWRTNIEQMRLNGNALSSNLFLHAGNYFGTWQRIDIPLFVNSEYCLLLDADTVIKRPFTIADFGLNLTYGISMSAEMDITDGRPWNAGVTVMNVPYLRKTHTAFLNYIFSHIDTAKFDHPAPSDQGAYLAYYAEVATYLSISFNFKPYWHSTEEIFDTSFIIHYHGPKPNDYVKKAKGEKCDDAIDFLCQIEYEMEFLCRSLQHFAASVDVVEYCSVSFQTQSTELKLYCMNFFDLILADDNSCTYYGLILKGSNDGLPSHTLQQKANNDNNKINNSNNNRIQVLSAKRKDDAKKTSGFRRFLPSSFNVDNAGGVTSTTNRIHNIEQRLKPVFTNIKQRLRNSNQVFMNHLHPNTVQYMMPKHGTTGTNNADDDDITSFLWIVAFLLLSCMVVVTIYTMVRILFCRSRGKNNNTLYSKRTFGSRYRNRRNRTLGSTGTTTSSSSSMMMMMKNNFDSNSNDNKKRSE